MKHLLTFLFIGTVGLVSAQEIPIPTAPPSVEFGDVEVNFTPEAQQLINAEMLALLTPKNSYLDKKLERMQAYFPLIEKVLEEENIPEDFKYLPVVESSLNPEAVSPTKAVGFWQFKEQTATEMGLRISAEVDERKEIIASTRAAARYLKRNNSLYHNWVSSALTFHRGAGGASTMLPPQWAYSKKITMDATADRYLIKAMAHRIAYEHHLNRMREGKWNLQTYAVNDGTWESLSRQYAVDKDLLKQYNSWLLSSRIPADKAYHVTIPYSNAYAEVATPQQQISTGFPELKRVSPTNLAPGEPILYEINGKKGILAEEGDEIPQVARKGKVGVYKFLRFNDMTERDAVTAGQVYYLQTKARRGKVPYHTVQAGQSLWDISQMYGIRMKRLLKLNRLKSNQAVQAGRVVWLQRKRPKGQPLDTIEQETEQPTTTTRPEVATTPKPNNGPGTLIDRGTPPMQPKPTTVIKDEDEVIPIKNDDELDKIFSGSNSTSKPQTSTGTPPAAVPSGIHIVQPGETLFGIARKYGVSVDEVRSWNNMRPSDVLQANQRIAINPKGTYPTPSATSTQPSTIEPAVSTPTPTTATSGTFHTVQAGETLFRISKNYGVTVEDLRRWNNLTDNTISVGQRLRVGGNTVTTTTTTASRATTNTEATTHTVQAGETLYRISKNYGVSVEQLRALNNLRDNTISVGQRLRIK